MSRFASLESALWCNVDPPFCAVMFVNIWIVDGLAPAFFEVQRESGGREGAGVAFVIALPLALLAGYGWFLLARRFDRATM
jgi:hypothetical protein